MRVSPVSRRMVAVRGIRVFQSNVRQSQSSKSGPPLVWESVIFRESVGRSAREESSLGRIIRSASSPSRQKKTPYKYASGVLPDSVRGGFIVHPHSGELGRGSWLGRIVVSAWSSSKQT